MFVFGAHAFVWGTTSTSVRQRVVPTALQGRVSSVYLIGVQGGIVVGGLAGGVIAGAWGVTAPFWFAFVGSASSSAALAPAHPHRPRRRGPAAHRAGSRVTCSEPVGRVCSVI